jgi:hypothetical protein
MKINDFANVLKEKLTATDLNFGDDADSVLGFLCGAYYDQSCNSDSEEIKQAFEDLYEAMNDETLREKDEVIYAVCRLCRSHQQTGFVDGVKLGILLSQELNN